MPFGEFRNEGGSLSLDDQVPIAMGYQVSIPLSLPLSFSRVGDHLSLKKVFYNASLYRGATDAKGTCSWESHKNFSRGYNFFSVFAPSFEKKQGNTVYYYGHFNDTGNFGGYVERVDSDKLGPLVSLNIITTLGNDSHLVAKISLTYASK